MSQQVLGQGRLGVKITSVIAYLRTVMRLPARQVQAYLKTLHGLSISVGEIVEVSHRLTKEMQPCTGYFDIRSGNWPVLND